MRCDAIADTVQYIDTVLYNTIEDFGPLALVCDRDTIQIDVLKGTMELLVEEQVLERRKKEWVRPEDKKVISGVLKNLSANKPLRPLVVNGPSFFSSDAVP